MSITIDLPQPDEDQLIVLARRAGQSVEAHVASYLMGLLKSQRELEAVAAPFADAFSKSGLTETDLDDLVEEARDELHHEKYGRPSKNS